MLQTTEWGPGRRDWMDVLRGLAVIMVVVTHTVRLIQYYDDPVPVLPTIINILTPLRMPMLFLLSGMLVPRSLLKGTWGYLKGKLSKVLYPYVLWTVILALLSALAAGAFVFPDLFHLLFIESATPLWFLGYLVLYYAIALLCRWVHPLIIAVAAVGLSMLPIEGEWERFWYQAVAFFIGVALGPFISGFERFLDNRILCAVLFTAATVAVTIQNLYGQAPQGVIWKVVITVTFFVGAAGLVRPIASARFLSPIRYVGERTIKVYILHWPFIEYPLRWMTSNGDVPLRWLIPITFLCGLVPPVIITVLADRYRAVEWFFEWNPPARRPRKASAKEPIER
ncbi:fucose 4-O-acetylase-like acetyltransferase [Microbacteriaceae bacterium SG_E_30_P1]|uniref:Fucose 4-O-acetylase-like acetyltransferase n=1 Tax=Antiquaquibacter oligotrophicus TaxID=2880260 RepID=A0ABT6KJ31_9MICO|nr:acyltransferase [Antiquaquibacter oligotrophicus]MDH6179908.1 fucose 4-O-acetylase-like acetyltransferase [Antiquaquibacter oligotrophicus]UDF14332.1 acyltransferase [Antiquaquibacter oligotrophicus]